MDVKSRNGLLASVFLPALLVLTGCAVGPDYVKPAISQTASFRNGGVSNGAAKVNAVELATWWRSFQDPTLERVVQLALQQNLDIAQAVARVQQAESLTESARAALLPAGQADATGARAHQSLNAPFGQLASGVSPGYDRNSNLYDAHIGVSWDLDLFGGLRRGRESAIAEYEAVRASSVAARVTVAASTADTYVLVRTLQARLEVARAQTETQNDRVRLIGTLFDRGIAPRWQLDSAKGALAEASAAVPVLEAGLISARNALDVLLGRNPGTSDNELDAVAAIPVAPNVDTATGPADLLRRRPDIIAAERHLVGSNARIGQAISDYYPKFSLAALFGFESTSGGDLFNGNSRSASGLLGMRWRLFDFGRVDAEVKAAKGKDAENLAAYRLSVLKATAEVEDSIAALVRRETQQAVLASGEESLGAARTAIEAGYRAGTSSYINLLDADSRLQRMQDARIVAQSESVRAAIASFKALGGGWGGAGTGALRVSQLTLRGAAS